VYYISSRSTTAPCRVRVGVKSAAGLVARVTLALLWTLGALAAAAAAEPTVYRAADTFEFRPGVIVDLAESRAYLMSPHHGIEALSLRSGELLWQTTAAARPLLLSEGRLIAQAERGSADNGLPLVVVSTRDAGRILSTTEIALPESVQVSIDDGPGTSFRASARQQGNRAIIDWSYSEQRVDGKPPSPDDPGVFADGALWLEADSGRHGLLTAGEGGSSAGHLDDHVRELIARESLAGPLWLTGGVIATIVRSADGHSLLRRWRTDTSEALPDIDLTDDGFSYRYVSADGRHALTSRRSADGTSDWLWRIYSLESGRQAALLRQKSAAARFFLTASELVHEAPAAQYAVDGVIVQKPLRLRAVNLGTASESWTRPLRDTTYRGGYLPDSGLPGSQPSTPRPEAANSDGEG
jgi:hypothetical protein